MKKFLIVLIILLNISEMVYANEILNQFQKSNIAESLNKESEIFPEFDAYKTVENLVSGKTLDHKHIIKSIIDFFLKEFYAIFKICFAILIIGLMSGIINALGESFFTKGTVLASKIAFYSVFASVSTASFLKVLEPAKESIESICIMIKASIPALITMTSLSGGIITAGFMNSVLILLVTGIQEVMTKIVFPVILASVALSVANNMSDRINVKVSVGALRQFSKWLIIFLMAIYTGFFGIYGISGAAIDKTMTKAAHFAIGTSVPIVGGVLADSIETILTTLSAVRNITGVLCIIVIVIVLLSPVLKTAAAMWCFKICCAFLEPFCDKNSLKLMLDITESLSLVFAVLICIMILFSACVGIILMSGNMLR